MANQTVTTNAVFIPTIVSNRALGALTGNMYLSQAVNRNWESAIQAQGSTVSVPTRGALTAHAKSADTVVTLNAPTATAVSVVLDTHEEVSTEIEDIAVAEANQDVLAGYAMDAAKVLAEKIETDGFSTAYAGFTTIAAIGTAAVDLSDALFTTMRKTLIDAKVDMSQPLWFFISTKDAKALFELDKYSRADAVGDGGAMFANGLMFRKAYGVNTVESQYIYTTGSTTGNIAFSPDALTLAMRRLPDPANGLGVLVSTASVPNGAAGNGGAGLRVLITYSGSYLATLLTVDALYGWKAVSPRVGLVVKT